MSAESPRHVRSGGPLTVPSQPPSDRSIIDAVSGFINDVTLSSSSNIDPKDVIQWARFETADINEPTPEGDSDNDISPLLLILGYGSGVQVWLIPPTGEAQEVLSWRQGTVRVLRILPTPQHGDCFASKRPLIALCDSASPGPTFCSLSFISIKGGEQVKSIKFKNPILDVLANKRSVVVSFSERFAVFDAATLEDRMAVTTCYPCPCPLGGSLPINPLALGDRWLAYADKKLNQSKRSSGGCEGEGVTSYTATVLHAAKSLSKGLRGLGESVAHSLGGRGTSQSPSPPNADLQQPGVVTILDIEGHEEEDGQESEESYEPIIAHFVAHSDAIIALKFDSSGMLLITADRRGHDFHVFRINPHPCGPGLASVHHLYILHRGDTTAKVQDIAISGDSRWTAISTLRGTTHVFALSAYGGAVGVRTHTAPRVVNRLSRFHRSAGLPIHGAPHLVGSPGSDSLAQGAWFPNPRLPPYPQPTTLSPLAQLRPTNNLPTHTITRTSSGRQRLSSMSEDNGAGAAPLLCRARFGPAPPSPAAPKPPLVALYLVAATGCLSHLALHPRPQRNIPKEKICDETAIELEVEPIAQWPLQRPAAAADLLAPLPPTSPLLQPSALRRCADMCMSEEERWLSQVEIVTHAGPHRRLWMGPQFVFKTYNSTGSNSSLSEAETVEVEPSVARSTPVNMPGARPIVPVLVDSGSASECSLEHSPSDNFRRKSLLAETGRAASVCDVRLKEDLAEAMKEDHGWRADEPRPRRAAPADRSRAVGPTGAVLLAPPVAPPRQAQSTDAENDADAHTADNADEAAFRPVVRAPAALPPRAEPLARPLPRGTTIPAAAAPPAPAPAPTRRPLPLATHRTIPAALGPAPAPALPDTPLDDGDDLPLPLPCDDPPPSDTRELERVEPFPLEKPVEEKQEKQKPPKETGSKKSKSQRDTASRIDKSLEKKETSPKPACGKQEEKPDKSTKQKESKSNVPAQLTTENEPRIDFELNRRPAADTAATVDIINIDLKATVVNKDLKHQEIDVRKGESARERSSAECVERERDDSKSLPKVNPASDDIQPTARTRLKKSPTPKSVSDRDSEVSVKDIKTREIDERKELNEPKQVKEVKEISKQKNRETKLKDLKEPKENKIKTEKARKDEKYFVEVTKIDIDRDDEKSYVEPTVAVTLKLPSNKDAINVKSKKCEIDIKTEEQAWDMLLNEPDRSTVKDTSPIPIVSDKVFEDKPKNKKNKKVKKVQDEAQAQADEDSFIEIHNIEEKQTCIGDLVSISTPLAEIEPPSYSSKSKKIRSSKSATPEKTDDFEKKPEEVMPMEPFSYSSKLKKKTETTSDIQMIPDPNHIALCKEWFRDSDPHLVKFGKLDCTSSENTSMIVKESPKTYKSKSLSPYPESRKLNEKLMASDKEVYVINTKEDDFPEIQITKSTKSRKKSPQPIETKTVEREIMLDKPAKSWSSIAAARKLDTAEPTSKKDVIQEVATTASEKSVPSPQVSLQDKLFELCKRRDIMVAECDAPSELTFVEEHHVLHDLPPLEPLDFGLDDFKLEVMRDSLLEVNEAKITSPICKINIDDILSSIKETTAKAIESSTFNLIELEKVPAAKERGFSVVESHKITSKEVKFEEGKEEGEGAEKSSDEDASPAQSTDSDKDDKKNAGAFKISMPSMLKQSAKSKKSRRKKK